MKEQTQYTFEDWLHNKFWNEKGLTEQYVCNDSEQYLHLVGMGKMTYEVLNKIQDEQGKAYEYMIKCTLETNERFFKRQAAKSLDLQKVIEIKIKKIEKYIQDNEDLYYDVILPRLHRGIKVGAKYILPEQYLEYIKNGFIDAFTFIDAPYQIGINGKLVSFPTDEQKKYAVMETQVMWLKRLQEYQKGDAAIHGIISGGEDYIKQELLPMLKEVEKKIQPQIESWNKTKIAAWVELLMDKGYFLPEYKRTKWRENCKAFAKTRYKTVVNTAMLVKEDTSRKTHKQQLLHYFKDVQVRT